MNSSSLRSLVSCNMSSAGSSTVGASVVMAGGEDPTGTACILVYLKVKTFRYSELPGSKTSRRGSGVGLVSLIVVTSLVNWVSSSSKASLLVVVVVRRGMILRELDVEPVTVIRLFAYSVFWLANAALL